VASGQDMTTELEHGDQVGVPGRAAAGEQKAARKGKAKAKPSPGSGKRRKQLNKKKSTQEPEVDPSDEEEDETQSLVCGDCADGDGADKCWACGRLKSDCKWKRKDGYGDSCITCPKILKHGWEAVGKTRADMKKSLATAKGKAFHEKTVESIESGEIKVRQLKEQIEVELIDEDALEFDEEHGNLWPVNIFTREFPDEPPPTKDELTTITKKGVQRTGIVCEPKMGTAIGVIRMHEPSRTVVRTRTNVAGKASELRALATG